MAQYTYSFEQRLPKPQDAKLIEKILNGQVDVTEYEMPTLEPLETRVGRTGKIGELAKENKGRVFDGDEASKIQAGLLNLAIRCNLGIDGQYQISNGFIYLNGGDSKSDVRIPLGKDITTSEVLLVMLSIAEKAGIQTMSKKVRNEISNGSTVDAFRYLEKTEKNMQHKRPGDIKACFDVINEAKYGIEINDSTEAEKVTSIKFYKLMRDFPAKTKAPIAGR